MSEQKKELSKLCLAGFIFTVLPSALMVLIILVPKIFYFLFAVVIISPLIGLVLSVAGLITAGRSGKKGKAFGIAGIAIQFVCLVVAISILGPIVAEHTSHNRKIMSNEMQPLGRLGDTSNTEYDVSQYMIPEGYDFNSLDITVSDTDFETYAENKLQTISNKTDKSIRGVFQDYNFLIVRSDRFDEWLSVNCPGGLNYYNGYAGIGYEDWWEFAASGFFPLAIYKDPSDKYIIITSCNDYKVIAEFFEGIGEAVPTTEETTEETIKETYGPEFFENNEQVVFLRENINEDMSLLEIIDVFDKACRDTRDTDWYTLEFGPFNYSTYDHYADEYVDQGLYYCFCMKRRFRLDDGRFYVICVSVLYEPNSENKDFKHVEMHSLVDIDGDFFEYARKSYSYNYASTEEISRIDIYMVEV